MSGEVYDFLEFVCQLYNKYFNDSFEKECNPVLKKELSGYRLIDGKIVQVTQEEEIEAIESAIKETNDKNSVKHT